MKWYKKLQPYLLILLCLTVFETSAKTPPFSIEKTHRAWKLEKNGTGYISVSLVYKILSPEGIPLLNTIQYTYEPEFEDMTIKEAYILQPDGKKIILGPNDIFLRPSVTSAHAPGFVNTKTLSLVCPALQVGSRIFIMADTKRKKWGEMGIYDHQSPNFYFPSKNFLWELDLPLKKDLPLQIAQKLDLYKIEDKENLKTQRRHVRISFKEWTAKEAEPEMAPDHPECILTHFTSWRHMAQVVSNFFDAQVIVTPEIKNMAQKIVGNKKGKDAAEALYNWVAKEIAYIAIYLDPNHPWRPHAAPDILKNRYGDCKDKVTLLRAFAKAIGIESSVTLVNGNEYYVPVLPGLSFNHAIIYFPAYNIFADPTNQLAPFGILSNDYYETPMLIGAPLNKLQIFPTPDPHNNLYKMEAQLFIKPDGTLEGKNNILTTGTRSIDYRWMFFDYIKTSEEKAREVLQYTPEGGTGELTSENIFNLSPSFTMKSHWTTPKIVQLEGHSSFLVPYGVDPRLSLPFLRHYFTSKPRKYPFLVCPSLLEWHYAITPPPGWDFGMWPKNQSFETSYASYKSSYSRKGQHLIVRRHLTFKKTIIPPTNTTEALRPIEIFLLDLRQPIFLKKK